MRIGFAIVATILLNAPAQLASGYAELGPPPRFMPDLTLSESDSTLNEREAEIAAQASASGLFVDTTDRAAVVAFFNQNYRPFASTAIGWTGDYGTCSAGTTARAYSDATLLRVNYFRAMAGLPGTVLLSDPLNVKDQSAALMMSAHGALSHAPSPSFACYSQAGAQAAGGSNLALGVSGPAAITLYMDDTGTPSVGHRRWILYPPQVTMGTGSVPAARGKPGSNALWVLNGSGPRPSTPDGVAWPPRGFVPYQLLPTSDLWSFSYPGADFSAASVTMSRGNLHLSIAPESQSFGFGDNTVVWSAASLVGGLPSSDTTYAVNVSNVKIGGGVRAFAYNVIVIDPDATRATIVAAVLPVSRSVMIGTPATVFATIVNAGAATITGCEILLATSVPATVAYQTTNPATNAVTGSPNTPVSIAAGAAQSFVIVVTPAASISSSDLGFIFHCNGGTAPVSVGLNTLLFSAAPTPTPDVVALAATPSKDGIVNVPRPPTTQAGVCAVATVNVGGGGGITVSADTGSATLPLSISLCQTDPVSGACTSAVGPTVHTQMGTNASNTFGVFLTATGVVPFDPASNRIFVRFKDAGGVTRGVTSVAVRTQ